MFTVFFYSHSNSLALKKETLGGGGGGGRRAIVPVLTLHVFISKLKPPNLVTLPKISLFRLFEYIASIDVEDLRMASGDFGSRPAPH